MVETAALQSCDKEQQRSLIVKSRIGRRHASNLGLYFSHFRSDDKALGLSLSSSGSSCVVLAWKCTGVVAFFNLHRSTSTYHSQLHVSKQQNFFGTLEGHIALSSLSGNVEQHWQQHPFTPTQISLCNFGKIPMLPVQYICCHKSKRSWVQLSNATTPK